MANGIYGWSFNSEENGNSDTIINWLEGQEPSTVNNSARSMMQRIRELISDRGSSTVASGTANSLSVALRTPITALADGITFSFRPSLTNTGTVTINVNNTGAVGAVAVNSTGFIELQTGQLIAQNVYTAFYAADLNRWIITNATVNQIIPIGTRGEFFRLDAPPGWIKLDGGSIGSSTSNANSLRGPTAKPLFDLFWNSFGNNILPVYNPNGTAASRGSSSQADWDANKALVLFNELGLYTRGANGNGADGVGGYQPEVFPSHNHAASIGIAGGHTHGVGASFIASGTGAAGGYITNSQNGVSTSYAGDHSHSITIGFNGGNENRPKTRCVLVCAKL